MSDKVKISIVTINYNNIAGLKKTIDSVINQTYSNIEYLVIDGGSTDGSVEIITENLGNINFWISERDNGVYHAMNKGIAKAGGNYIVFLNSGDIFVNEKVLEVCINYIEVNPDADVYFGDIIIINHESIQDFSLRTHPNVLGLEFFDKDTINHQASLIKTELFNEIGFYPEYYKLASDYWLWLRLLMSNKVFIHINEPLIVYDCSGLSSINGYKEYEIERREIWKSVVPECVQQIILRNVRYENILQYNIVRAAVGINKQYQIFKRKLAKG